VLIVHAVGDGYSSDVESKLAALGVFSSLGRFDASAGTPTLSALQSFDAVLVISDDFFDDPAALGDVLADYVDGGGGVVLGLFTAVSLPAGLAPTGRFQVDDYFVLSPGTNTSGDGPYGMVVLDGGHPVLGGVSTFDGGTGSYRPVGSTVSSAYDEIAKWADVPGTPLVATRSIGGTRRVDLSFYPVTSDVNGSFVSAASDAMRIVANSLRWVAGDL
jgi:hypothetical protein